MEYNNKMIKYIRIASDLHAEQFTAKPGMISGLANFVLPTDEKDSESILILGGDISSTLEQLNSLLLEWLKRFPHVIYLTGNHEFYRYEINAYKYLFEAAEAATNPNLHFATLDMEKTEIAGVRFIFGTLWADGGHSPVEESAVQNALNDFYVIRVQDPIKDAYNIPNLRRFRVFDMQKLHRKQKAQLEAFLAEPFDGKTVVSTHHLPSYELCHPRFGNVINGGFASDSDEILWGDNSPDLWTVGHTHDQIDRRLGKSRVVCNPRGYRHETNATEFNQYCPVFIPLEDL